jgi:hypothetical protein
MTALKQQIRQRMKEEGAPYLPYFEELWSDLPASLRKVMSILEGEGSGAPVDMIVGSETSLFVTTENGIREVRGTYILTDSNRLIASHIPHLGPGAYRTHPDYPEGVQERRYHRDLAEVQKVRDNARNFQPSMVNNNNPDAVNGPPVVDKNMLVLGGNSRAMTQQLLYLDGKGEKIRQHLRTLCSLKCFGFSPSDVNQFEQPVLVRQVSVDALEDKEEARRWVRILNESFTQSLDASSEAVARASKLTEAEWKQLIGSLSDALFSRDAYGRAEGLSPLYTFLGKEHSSDFVLFLRNIGVLDTRNVNRYTFIEGKNKGLLNRDGRRFLLDLLVGHILENPSLMQALPLSLSASLEEMAPYVIVAACCDSAWDIREDLRSVCEVLTFLPRSDGLKEVLASSSFAGSYGQVQSSSRRKLLFHIMWEHRSRKSVLRDGIKKYAIAAGRQNEDQASMFCLIDGDCEGEVSAKESESALAKAFSAFPDPLSPSGYQIAGTALVQLETLRESNPKRPRRNAARQRKRSRRR